MNGNHSRAQEQYNQIAGCTDPVSFLDNWVTTKKTENEFLEFKGAGKISDQQIKEHWSQVLSGFANTEGGVVVWGIRATRISLPSNPSRRIDAADSLDLVPNPEALVQALKDVMLEAAIPPVQGVKFAHHDKPGSGGGFVVCLIPESTHKPHRAQLDERQQYYQRIVDKFVVIPHSLLRSLFYPITGPVFEIDIGVTWTTTDQEATLEFKALLRNTGTATARELVAVVLPVPKSKITPAPNWRLAIGRRLVGEAIECVCSLHPGQACMLFDVSMTTGLRQTISEQGTAYLPEQPGMNFILTLYCADHEAQTAWISFDSDDIERQQHKRVVAVSGNPAIPPNHWHLFLRMTGAETA